MLYSFFKGIVLNMMRKKEDGPKYRNYVVNKLVEGSVLRKNINVLQLSIDPDV